MDEASGTQILSIIALTVFFGGFVLAILVIFNKKSSSETEENSANNSQKNAINENDKKGSEKQSEKRTTQVKEKAKVKVKETQFSHPLLMANLKGHTGPVLEMEFSACGNYLGSCSEDRTVRLWMTKEFSEKEHKYIRTNVELDHARSISFSPDSRAFIASLGVDNTIRIFKINKRKEGNTPAYITTEVEDFPKIHKTEIISVGISSTGKFIMSASKDTTIVLWTLKGEVVTTIDTLLVYNTYAALSPSGTLVASSGFTSDIKMWHVEFDKNGQFKTASRAFELKGHSAGVHSFSFSSDSKKVASISKDGSWKLWDIDVNYLKGQEAYLLFTGSYANYFSGNLAETARIAISPDGFTVAIANGKSIVILDTETKERSNVISDAHGDNINCLSWHPDSRKLASSGHSDKTVRVWHNVIGVRALLIDLKQKVLKVTSDSHKERIELQIREAKQYLKKFSSI